MATNFSQIIKYEILNYFIGGLAYPAQIPDLGPTRGLNYRNVFFARLSSSSVDQKGRNWVEFTGEGYKPQLLNRFDDTKDYAEGRYLNPFSTGVGTTENYVTNMIFVKEDVNFGPAQGDWDPGPLEVGIWCGPPSWDLPKGVGIQHAGDLTTDPVHFFGGFVLGHAPITLKNGERIRYQAPTVTDGTVDILRGLYFMWGVSDDRGQSMVNSGVNGPTCYQSVMCADPVDIAYEPTFKNLIKKPSNNSLGAFLGDGNIGVWNKPLNGICDAERSREYTQASLPDANRQQTTTPPYVRFTLRSDLTAGNYWDPHPDLTERIFSTCSFGARMCQTAGAYAKMWHIREGTSSVRAPKIWNAPYLTFPAVGTFIIGRPNSLGIGYYYWFIRRGFDQQTGIMHLSVSSPELFFYGDVPVILSGDIEVQLDPVNYG